MPLLRYMLYRVFLTFDLTLVKPAYRMASITPSRATPTRQQVRKRALDWSVPYTCPSYARMARAPGMQTRASLPMVREGSSFGCFSQSAMNLNLKTATNAFAIFDQAALPPPLRNAPTVAVSPPPLALQLPLALRTSRCVWTEAAVASVWRVRKTRSCGLWTACR